MCFWGINFNKRLLFLLQHYTVLSSWSSVSNFFLSSDENLESYFTFYRSREWWLWLQLNCREWILRPLLCVTLDFSVIFCLYLYIGMLCGLWQRKILCWRLIACGIMQRTAPCSTASGRRCRLVPSTRSSQTSRMSGTTGRDRSVSCSKKFHQVETKVTLTWPKQIAYVSVSLIGDLHQVWVPVLNISRYRWIAGTSTQHGDHQQMRAVSCWRQRDEAEHRLVLFYFRCLDVCTYEIK